MVGAAIGIGSWHAAAIAEENLVDRQALIAEVDDCAEELPLVPPQVVDMEKQPAWSTIPEDCQFDDDKFAIAMGKSRRFENVENPDKAPEYMALTQAAYSEPQIEYIEYRADWARDFGKFGRASAAALGFVIALGLLQGAREKTETNSR